MSDDKLFEEVGQLMDELSNVDTDLRMHEAAKDERVKEVVDLYAAKINPLALRRDEIMAELAQRYVQNEAAFTSHHGKTAVLRSGTISARSSSGSIVVTDEEKAMNYLRNRGILRRFTRMGKRTIDKVALKKHPDIAAKIPGLAIDKPEYLRVKLARAQVELKKPLSPFRIRSK